MQILQQPNALEGIGTKGVNVACNGICPIKA